MVTTVRVALILALLSWQKICFLSNLAILKTFIARLKNLPYDRANISVVSTYKCLGMELSFLTHRKQKAIPTSKGTAT